MKITETKLEGVLIIELDVFNDNRGWFAEFYNKKKLADSGVQIDFVQVNHSFTKNKGTLRGLHFQNHPHAQAKLVSCIKGAILDVAVDLRKNSPTYKEWLSVELSEDNKKQLLVPRGFAHGILTLTDDAHIYYKIDNHYNKEAEGFLHYGDPELNIDWGIDNPILIERDANAPFLKDCDSNFE